MLTLLVPFLCFSVYLDPSHAADSVSTNQSLSGDQTIISSGGEFELGFFSPGHSSKYYIGIWYKKITERTVVWVANREAPVPDKNSAELKILDGNLVLVNGTGIPVWSSSVTSSNPVVAVLLDSGNLVLRDVAKLASADPIWQSFDYPGDTLLPGAKFGYDKRTHKKQLLTSWKNAEDPAPGLFSFELDPNESQFIASWNRTEPYWITGPWNGQVFSLMTEMSWKDLYNFSYVDNTNESYYIYSLYNSSRISRFILDVSGEVKQLSWASNEWFLVSFSPRQQCGVYAYCGAFGTCDQNSSAYCTCLPGFEHKSENDWNLKDYSGGCVRKISLQCENSGISDGQMDKFLMNKNMKLPGRSRSLRTGSAQECESACLGSCSCAAYAYDDDTCSLWDGELLNLQQLAAGDGSARTIHVRLSASAPEFSGEKKSKAVVLAVVIGGVAVAVVVLLVIIIGFFWMKRAKIVGPAEGSLVAFGYRDLQNATNNFSEKLGGGGFGSVFKGTLPGPIVVAVKKLESVSQGEKQFRAEVSTVGTIHHQNLVRLRGFCSEGSKKLLAYDFMENGSLDSHLFNVKDKNVLDWKTRYHVALGVARGLAYLHESCRDCIIHCDIKPENILLDSDFCPKVADFGLAKLVGRDFSRVLTTMRGTRGYLAPEWITGVAITAKADVYSYGMMLLELVSGRRNLEQFEDGKVRFFPSWAANVTVIGGDILSLLDPALDRKADEEQVLKLCKVACWSIQDYENNRPSMGRIVQILEGVMDVSLPPIPRSFQVLADSQENIMFFTDSSSSGTSSQVVKSTTSSTCSPSRLSEN